MSQVKKEEIRVAILEAAFKLFSREGYVRTTLPMIGREAGVSTPNIYSYFPSKLTIFYQIYDPWVRDQFAILEAQLLAIGKDPRGRLHRLLDFLWRELPGIENCFANNVVQAISTATPEDQYRTDLIDYMEREIERMLLEALPPKRRAAVEGTDLPHMIVMTMDGYIMYRRTRPERPCSPATIEATCDLLLGK